MSERALTIRPATEADLEALLAMAARFIAASPVYREVLAVVPACQAAIIEVSIDQGGTWVLDGPEGVVGMLVLLLAPLPLTGEVAALECAWWIEPESRQGTAARRLWAAGEAWAQAQGATAIHMVQPAGETALGVWYARRGYQPIETTWQKRLAS